MKICAFILFLAGCREYAGPDLTTDSAPYINIGPQFEELVGKEIKKASCTDYYCTLHLDDRMVMFKAVQYRIRLWERKDYPDASE